MVDRKKKTLETGYGGLPRAPVMIPADPQDLLDLMDHAATIAGTAEGATAPAFDHGMRVFNQLHAHFQMRIAIQLAETHQGLERATRALKVATWWLGAVTVGLGLLELWKMVHGH